PRWSEDPESLARSATTLGQGKHENLTLHMLPHPEWGREDGAKELEDNWKDMRLGLRQRAALEERIRLLRTYLGLRETAKHYLLKGFAVLRRILLELGRRYQLGGDIFFLIPEELPRLAAGEVFTKVASRRRRRRAIALSLEVPQVLFSDDLLAIGRP